MGIVLQFPTPPPPSKETIESAVRELVSNALRRRSYNKAFTEAVSNHCAHVVKQVKLGTVAVDLEQFEEYLDLPGAVYLQALPLINAIMAHMYAEVAALFMLRDLMPEAFSHVASIFEARDAGVNIRLPEEASERPPST